MKRDLEEKHRILGMVESGLSEGKVTKPRHYIDNYCLSLDDEDGNNIFKDEVE